MGAPRKRYNNNNHNNRNNRIKKKDMIDYQQLFAKLSKNGVIVDGKLSTNLKRKITSYTKEQVETFLANPSQYESQLRGVSNYLMQTDLHYWRTIMYMSTLAKIAPVVIPHTFGLDNETIKNNFFEAVKHLDYMNLPHELGKVITRCFVEDVFYGIVCDDGNSFYIKRLDPDYCRISSVSDGVYNFEFDLNYFKKDTTNKLFEGYCKIYPEFKYLMKKFRENAGEDYQWVEIKPSKSICIKLQENLDSCIPPFVGSFKDLYDLDEYKDLAKNASEVGNFKLIGLEIPLNSKSGKVDDFLVDASTANMFYQMMEENLPEGVGAFLTPMTPKEIEFDVDTADQESVSNAIKNYYDTTGVSNILFSGSDTTGGLKYSIKTDEMLLIGSGGLYRQLERWVNRYFKYKFQNTVSIKLLDVTSFNIDEKKAEYLKDGQYGVPCRSELAVLGGKSQAEMVSMTVLENDILNLTETWIPLSSSHTFSGRYGTTTDDNDGVIRTGRPGRPRRVEQDDEQSVTENEPGESEVQVDVNQGI